MPDSIIDGRGDGYLLKINTDGSINTQGTTSTSTSYALQIDEASGSITYIGEAAVGSLTSASSWRIKRMDESGDPELIIKWADGDADFNNIWDDRASLTYS